MLGNNKFEDGDTEKLATMLVGDYLITRLDLSMNKIGTNGARALGECLKVNKTLTNLDLSMINLNTLGFNSLKEGDVRELILGLKVNTTITMLNLCKVCNKKE